MAVSEIEASESSFQWLQVRLTLLCKALSSPFVFSRSAEEDKPASKTEPPEKQAPENDSKATTQGRKQESGEIRQRKPPSKLVQNGDQPYGGVGPAKKTVSFARKPSEAEKKKKNRLETALSLVKGFKIGGDLLSLELPPQLLLPSSELQYSGESFYSVGEDLFSQCTDGKTPVERLLNVVRWYLTAFRTVSLASPYMPLLGETHHVTTGDVNIILEEVAVSPPTTAVHATNSSKRMRMTEWHATTTRFYGAWMEAEITGRNYVKLDAHKETYESSFPKLSIRFLPVLAISWFGTITVKCAQTDLEAQIKYRVKPIFGGKQDTNRIEGRVLKSSTKEALYELRGRFDEVVFIKDVRSGVDWEFYDYRKVLTKLPKLKVIRQHEIEPTESCAVWVDLTNAIIEERWSDASKAQSQVENEKRRIAKERKAKKEPYAPKYFVTAASGKGWEWKGFPEPVPRAPIETYMEQ